MAVIPESEGESDRRGGLGVGQGPGGWLVVGSFYRANSSNVTKSSHQGCTQDGGEAKKMAS